MRYTTTIAIVAILAFATQTASAAASREENIGVGSGAIVGAIAGGPVSVLQLARNWAIRCTASQIVSTRYKEHCRTHNSLLQNFSAASMN